MERIEPVKLKISQKLRDREYRKAFFEEGAKTSVQDRIRDLIKIRNTSQLELAQSCGMKPSAMSRVLSEDYSSWNFKTLIRIADALDCELRISFVLAEEVIAEFEQKENHAATDAADHLAPVQGLIRISIDQIIGRWADFANRNLNRNKMFKLDDSNNPDNEEDIEATGAIGRFDLDVR